MVHTVRVRQRLLLLRWGLSMATFMVIWYEVDDQTQHVAYTHTEEDAKTLMRGFQACSDDVRWAQWYRSIGDANDLPGEGY